MWLLWFLPLIGACTGLALPQHSIDLDLPPRQRWKRIAAVYRDWWISAAPHSTAQMNKYDLIQLDEFYEAQTVDQEYLEELQGIVEVLDHPAATLKQLVLRNLKYELGITQGFECSGVLAAGPGGTVVHGRNLDLARSMGWVRGGLMEVTFLRGGQPVVTAPNFFSTVGIHTGMRHGHFSFEQNTRFDLLHHARHDWVQQSINAAKLGGKGFLFEARNILTQHDSFSKALAAVGSTKFTAPQYFIMGGARPYEGAVITLGRAERRGHFVDIDVLNEAMGKWFLVETNDDHWSRPMDGRRESAQRMMSRIGWRSVSATTVMNTMRARPVCNPGTIFSWVAVPATGATELISSSC
mmetsp:Transcript_32584/g.75713  ORF Transcript_32584/g.75713 Transcript_32584/m.75713 type:complete len:353 (-) Transcript_32584:100-1158(-)